MQQRGIGGVNEISGNGILGTIFLDLVGLANSYDDIASPAIYPRTNQALLFWFEISINDWQSKRRIESQYLFVFITKFGELYKMIAGFSGLGGASCSSSL